MDRSGDMEAFVRTVRYGSFSAAARSLDLTPAAVSHRIAQLEARLGTRLLHRTTRRLSLTEDGAEYFSRAERVLEEIHEIEAAVSKRDGRPRGTLKVAAPSSFGRQHIVPLVPRFLREQSSIQLKLVLGDEFVDIVREGVDLAVRICRLDDSEFIAKKLAPDRRVVCASPAYLRRNGVPVTPKDLANHNCIGLSQQRHWTFQGPMGLERVRVAGNFECNNGETLRELAIAGVGIALKATWDIAPALQAGSLRILLEGFPVVNDTSIWALYPSRRNLPAKVSVFVSYLREHFKAQAWYSGGAGP